MLRSRLLLTVATGVLAAGTAAAPAFAVPGPAGPVTSRPSGSGAGEACEEDVKYLVRAHRGNLVEQAAGKAALEESRNPWVLRIAGMLVRDHSRFDVRVVAAAAGHDVALPPKPTRQQRADLDAVTEKSGRAFDLAWLRLQEAAHRTTLDYIDRERRDGCADDVTALAEAAEGTVESHLAEARRALAALEG